jgi:hypothetical protein
MLNQTFLNYKQTAVIVLLMFDVSSGMYGGIVIHSKDETIANSTNEEKSTIQREEKEKIGSFDTNKFISNKPDLILTNGMAYKYIPFFGSESRIILNTDAEIFKVKPGELTRWYIVNAGPRGYLAFNFASGMINSVVYDSSSNNNKSIAIGRNDDNAIIHSSFENNNITLSSPSKKIYEVSIPPGSAEAIEVTFPEEGTYVGNDHDIGRFLIGAGFVVVATNNSSTFNDYPKGTWVTPYGHGASNINNIHK